MWEQLVNIPDLMLYILAVELLILCILQLRTNGLLKKEQRIRMLKTEKIKTLKEEVKNGESAIPVVKFEKTSKKAHKSTEQPKNGDDRGCFDAKEMKVLQDMLAEYFG